jgi:hypothetical protein
VDAIEVLADQGKCLASAHSREAYGCLAKIGHNVGDLEHISVVVNRAPQLFSLSTPPPPPPLVFVGSILLPRPFPGICTPPLPLTPETPWGVMIGEGCQSSSMAGLHYAELIIIAG